MFVSASPRLWLMIKYSLTMSVCVIGFRVAARIQCVTITTTAGSTSDVSIAGCLCVLPDSINHEGMQDFSFYMTSVCVRACVYIDICWMNYFLGVCCLFSATYIRRAL